MKVRVIANYQEYRSGAILWLDSKNYERLRTMGVVEPIPENDTSMKSVDAPPKNKMMSVAPAKKRGRPFKKQACEL